MKPAVWAVRFPWLLLTLAVVLILAGWAGIARFEQFVDSPGRFLQRQIVWSVISLFCLLAATMPNYRILCRWAYAFFATVVFLLVVVYFFPAINGAHRWIRVGPLGFQPSEFAKIACVLALARYLMYRDSHRSVRGLVVPFALALAPAVLILREPDLGTAIVFLPVLLSMLFYAGARRRDLVKVCLAGLLVLPFLWTQMSREQRSRVTALFEQNAPSETPTAGGYHLHQSKQMFALGGLWGSFLTGAVIDDPAAYHLPEAHTDFIFAVIGERFGLWGTGLVLIFFCLLAWRGAALAAATREPFGRLVAAGLVSLFAVEVAVNTSMTVGLAPITGLSLPLVSYGGSGLLAHLVALGLIMNVALRPGYEIAAEPFQFARSDRSRKRNGASRPVKRLQASGYRETGANRYLGPEA